MKFHAMDAISLTDGLTQTVVTTLLCGANIQSAIQEEGSPGGTKLSKAK